MQTLVFLISLVIHLNAADPTAVYYTINDVAPTSIEECVKVAGGNNSLLAAAHPKPVDGDVIMLCAPFNAPSA